MHDVTYSNNILEGALRRALQLAEYSGGSGDFASSSGVDSILNLELLQETEQCSILTAILFLDKKRKRQTKKIS